MHVYSYLKEIYPYLYTPVYKKLTPYIYIHVSSLIIDTEIYMDFLYMHMYLSKN